MFILGYRSLTFAVYALVLSLLASLCCMRSIASAIAGWLPTDAFIAHSPKITDPNIDTCMHVIAQGSNNNGGQDGINAGLVKSGRLLELTK